MLERERLKASFDKNILSSMIYGSKEAVKGFIQRQKMVERDIILKFNPIDIQKSRADIMRIFAAKLVRFHQIFPLTNQASLQKTFYFSEQLPYMNHDTMFILTLKNLCNQQQIKMFLQPAERRQIIGCYAQTEIAHGSDVQGLMTTATFDQKADSFIIHTPDTKAAKWWIGDLGVFCTHACVFAQLIINNKRYGIHAFIIPLRDEHHKPYPGVQVGDIGPKPALNCKAHGYLIFSNYTIPRLNMLMKFSQISKQGVYSKIGDDKITYITMLQTRVNLTNTCYIHMSKAIVILVRYSLVRTQFKDKHGKEIPILNYQLQQEKIFPRISETFANLFGRMSLIELANNIVEEAKIHGTYQRLNEAHALSSLCKVIFSKDAMRGVQILRKAAGGHGYSSYSGLPILLGELTPTVTYQGQNTVLMLQVARFLIKNLKIAQKGKRLPQSTAYLQKIKQASKLNLDCNEVQKLRNADILITMYMYNAIERLKRAYMHMQQGNKLGLDEKTTWDTYAGLQLVEAATAHSYYWIFQNFYYQVQLISDLHVHAVIYRVLLLYGIQKILQRSLSFIETQTITSNTLKSLNILREKLFQQIRPDALTIVESFEYQDGMLFSAIGQSDGKAYEHLLDWSKHHNQVNNHQNAKQIRQVWINTISQVRQLIPKSTL